MQDVIARVLVLALGRYCAKNWLSHWPACLSQYARDGPFTFVVPIAAWSSTYTPPPNWIYRALI